MKKYKVVPQSLQNVEAASDPTGVDSYLENVEDGRDKLAEVRKQTDDNLKKIVETVTTLKDQLANVDVDSLLYWYDKGQLGEQIQNPEEMPWFESISQDDADRCYEAYENAANEGSVLKEYGEILEEVKYLVDEKLFSLVDGLPYDM